MQLTILLDLLHKHGDAVPNQRTKLYDAYVEMLLIREANKHPDSVRKHQDDLREIIPFLGWYLHAHTESDRVNNQMPVADLKATIGHFQRTYANPEDFVDELFEAVSDRLWALTSKVEGSYEFEVLSLREYFAARFLYRYAGEDQRGFDRNEVLRELLRRPYWLNTARFYGGNAEVGDVSVLADGLIDELADNPPPQSVIAAWTLLTDGVFTTRPRRARGVLQALCADIHSYVLLNALTRRDIRLLPDLPALPANEGPDPTWTRLTQEINADPASRLARPRVRVLRELLNQRNAFGAWWTTQAVKAQGDPSQLDAWLEIASECEAAAGHRVELPDADLDRELVAQRILDTGLVPLPGSDFESSLVEAVFDGRCPNVNSVRSLPAQIAVAFGAEDFLSATKSGSSQMRV